MNSNDQLTKTQNKLKLLNMISKQLSKHWFFSSYDTNCEKSFIQSNFDESFAEEPDILTETVNIVKNSCEGRNSNVIYARNRTDSVEKSLNDYLELNEKCFLYKGFINWISYLAFQSVQPDLFDLVHLEWSLIKEVDENYFLADQNLKHIYQSYEFPRLAENNNFQKIKTEIKVKLF